MVLCVVCDECAGGGGVAGDEAAVVVWCERGATAIMGFALGVGV